MSNFVILWCPIFNHFIRHNINSNWEGTQKDRDVHQWKIPRPIPWKVKNKVKVKNVMPKSIDFSLTKMDWPRIININVFWFLLFYIHMKICICINDSTTIRKGCKGELTSTSLFIKSITECGYKWILFLTKLYIISY